VLLTEVSCKMYASWETYHQHSICSDPTAQVTGPWYYNGYRWRLCSAEVTIVYTHNRGWIEMWMDGFMISTSNTKRNIWKC